MAGAAGAGAGAGSTGARAGWVAHPAASNAPMMTGAAFAKRPRI
jgi:hypothetical protein